MRTISFLKPQAKGIAAREGENVRQRDSEQFGHEGFIIGVALTQLGAFRNRPRRQPVASDSLRERRCGATMDELLMCRYKSLIRVLAMYVEVGKHKWLVSYPLLIVNIVERMSIVCTGLVLRMRASASRLPSLAIVARSIHTETINPKQSMTRLNQQRSVRPNSPHLTIYQPQVRNAVISD